MWFRFLLLFAPVLGAAAERPTGQQIEGLIREYANRINPTLDPAMLEFDIQRFEVPNLWDQLGAEVYSVNWLFGGKWFNGYTALYRDGKMSVIAPNLVGHGLMSAVVHKGALYYTYSWGQQIHRSHVALLEIADGKIKLSDTGGFSGLDLFVSAKPDGSIQVTSADFQEFNAWKMPKEFGVVRHDGPARLSVVGPGGKVVEPTFPR